MKFDPIEVYEKLSSSDLNFELIYGAARLKTLEQESSLAQNFSYSEFQSSKELIQKIQDEKDRILNEFKDFYFGKCKGNLTVEEVYTKLKYLTLRMARLQYIFTPTYYHYVYQKKEGYVKYDKIKIVWIDDNWIKQKNITRTFGQVHELVIAPSVIKFLVDHKQYEHIKEDYATLDKDSGFKLITKIDGEDWVYEFKIMNENKEVFMKDMVILNLWRIYKDVYKM